MVLIGNAKQAMSKGKSGPVETDLTSGFMFLWPEIFLDRTWDRFIVYIATHTYEQLSTHRL